jgi:hypothetical protein
MCYTVDILLPCCTVGGPFVAQSVGCYCVVVCVVLLLLHGRWVARCTVGGPFVAQSVDCYCVICILFLVVLSFGVS